MRNGNLNKEVEIFAYVVKGSYDGNMWEKVTRKKRLIDSVMRGDPLVNKVADSEDSMSFGELQAAALDSPLMKERTEIANKLAGLEVTFRAHRNQQLQNKVLYGDLSKKIPTLKRQIEMITADIKARTDTRGDKFKIKLGDKIYTNRADADKILQGIIENFKEVEITKIGEIGGFDINLRLENLYKQKSSAMEVAQRQVIITLMNHGTYRVKTNSVVGIENTLRNEPDSRLKEATSNFERATSKLKEVEKQLDKPFEQQAEMEETRRKLEEIDKEINITDTTKQAPENKSVGSKETLNTSLTSTVTEFEVTEFEKSGQKIFMTRLDDDDSVSLFKIMGLENASNFDAIIATIAGDNKSINVIYQNESGNHKFTYSIGIDEIDKATSDKDIENKLTTYLSQAAIEYAQQSGKLTTELYKIQLSSVIESFASRQKEPVIKMYNEFRKYVPYGEKLNAEQTAQQAEESVTEIKKWEDLSEDEQFKRLNIDYKTLEVDDLLQEKLSAAYPNVKEWIKILVEQGKGGDVFTNRKERTVWENARKDIAQLLKNESLLTSDAIYTFAAKSLFKNWEILKIHIPSKPSQKSLNLQAKANEILSQLNNKDISPQESYEKLIEWLYNKEESADANQQFFGAKKTSENVMPNQQEESTQQVEEIPDTEKSAVEEITPPSINEFSKRSGSEDNVTYAKFLIDHKKVNGKSTWYQITAFDGIEKISQAKAQNLFRQAEVFNLDNYVMYIDDAGDILKQTFAIVRRISIWQRIWEAKNDKNKQDRTYQKTVEISDKLWKGAISPYEANEELKKTIGSGAEEELQDLNNFIALGRTKFEAPRRNHLRFSHTGNGSTAIINLVDDRNLTEPHKLLQQFGESIGVDVQFFNNYNKNFHGAYENGTVYLNVNSARSLTSTFAHEIFHFLKANNPKLFEEIAKAAGITQEQLTNYLAETQRTDVKETADVTEEMIADAMQEILNRVARKDKSLVERFFAWLKDTLQKFKDIFNNPKGKLTRAQYARMADTFGKMAVKLKDADGNKIFRYNTRTHNLELANGESLDGLLEDTENEIYSSDEQGFFNLGRLSLDGLKLSATGNIDNDDKKVDNTKNANKKINDYLTITADGTFDVKLLNERPAVGKETERERIERRKKEIANMDKLLDVKVNPDAYAQLLTDRTIDALKKYAEQLGSWDKAEKGLRLKYNSFLANYSKSNPEKKVISYLLNLKGAIRYAGQRKSDARGDRVDYNGGTGQSVRGIGKILDEETKAKGTRTETGTNEINQRHSDNQGVFYLDGNRKNSIGSSGNTATLTNARYSIGSSSSDNSTTRNDNSSEGTIGKWFSSILDKFSRALGLKGDRIVTAETAAKRFNSEREKVMDDYIKNPSKENLKRLKDLKISKAMLDAYKNGEEYIKDVNISDVTWHSPSRVAEKVAAFRAYFRMGDKAMDKLVKLRDQFSKKLNAATDFLKSNDDNETLTNLLIDGDANEIEYGVLTEQEKNSIIASTSPENVTKQLQQARIQKICDEAGVSENVAKAYVKIRQLMTQAYHMLNDAKRRPQTISAYRTDKTIEELKNNKFVKIIKISDTTDDNGNLLVTYKRYAHTKKEYDVTESVLERFKKDSAMQVLNATIKDFADGEKIYHVEVLEGIAELTNRAGYIPHLFHEYFIRVKDKDGKIVERFGYGGLIGSGRTQREAIKIAEDWKKKNPNGLKDGEEIYIEPKIANFGNDEKNYAPIMGDKDFDAMVHNIAKYSDMTIKDAKALVDGSVKLKNRHRFFGNFLQRKGAKGYSQDMQWVLRHYLNSVARYVALETEFKPQAISLFERHFGSFEKDWENNSLAKFTKQFINDINGNPSTLETMLNKVLNKSTLYKNFIVPSFGERAALTLTNDITRRVGYLKLGMLNLSSALLNLSQLINAAGYLGGGGRLMKHLGSVLSRKGKLTLKELRILSESGVLSDIGIDTSSGYDRNRNYSGSSIPIIGKALTLIDVAGNKSMYIFQTMDTLCRISSTLAAYEQAIEQGKSRSEALEFAKEVNRKANFSYGVEDAPNMFRRSGVIGKIILQFKKYPIKMLEVIGDFLPMNKKTSMQQKIAFWFPYLLMCGLMGLPFLDWLDDLFGEKFGLFPKDFLQKTAIKGSQAFFGDNELGRMAGKIAMYGAPAAFNIDISKRAGLSAIMPEDLWSLLLGATGSTVTGFTKNVFDGVVNDTDGAYLNALRSISPGVYNFYAAFEGETLGTRGRKTSVYESMYDRIIRGAGFKSVDESLATDIQRITYNERDKLTKEKQRAVDAFIKEPTAANAKILKELGVKPDTVKKERERKKLDRLGRVKAGLTKAEQ
ncbi:MAG: hypothetical protein IJS81_10570, partial [Selenomonadaceae bacterium]|nr:hypothetical protein [Selenomonadaceae bacterium]